MDAAEYPSEYTQALAVAGAAACTGAEILLVNVERGEDTDAEKRKATERTLSGLGKQGLEFGGLSLTEMLHPTIKALSMARALKV